MRDTHYARSGSLHIAYQVCGTGPDLVYVPGWLSHLELDVESVASRRFFEDLETFSRLTRFDKRGTGMSDREDTAVSLEDRVADIGAVMDAVGAQRASLFGYSEGGAMAAVFAAMYPERVDKLVLFASHAGKVTGSPDFPCGYESHDVIARMRSIVENNWGEGGTLEILAPSVWSHRMGPQAREWMARYERAAATPGAALAHFEFNMHNDARRFLPEIAAPTLVLHRRDDPLVPVCNAEYLAAAIPNAQLVIVDGEDHAPFMGDTARVVDEVGAFLGDRSRTHARARRPPVIATDDVHALTPAEYRIAEAVAAGLTNPQIAEALHLSRHTVESHLKRIYAKLGITRVELATRIARVPRH
jgi:pimeloyl-ACP methyl ester carboxylesterase/DNA-binding CsgD family transcriptional regulator